MGSERKTHPAADLLPPMTESELANLVEDVRAHGLRVPIVVTPDDELLDGRHRERACEIAGVEPRYETYDGDPVAFVASLNAQRRNLTPSQLAIAAAEAWDLVEVAEGRRAKHLARMFGVNNAYVSEARALLERAPKAAAEVKAAGRDLHKSYKKLRELEKAAEDELEAAQNAVEEARKRYEELLADPPAELDLPPLAPEELVTGGADIALEAATTSDEDDEPLDGRARVREQDDLILAISGLATRIAQTPPILREDRFLDLSVLSARDAVRRMSQNMTTWLRNLNEQYQSHTQERHDGATDA